MTFRHSLKRWRSATFAVSCFLTVQGLVMAAAVPGFSAEKTPTVSEIALYRGPDRMQRLIEGARRERELLFYNSNTWMARVSEQFEKKYPFTKVTIWRSESPNIVKRVFEEYASNKFIVDVIETSEPGLGIMHGKGVFQEHYSPDEASYDDDVKVKGKAGVFYMADREVYYSLSFNTKAVSPAEAPRAYKDLLDPKWKGRMHLAGGSIGPKWVGNVLNVMGMDFLEKLSQQEVKVQNMTPAALASLVASGEVPVCLAGGYSTITLLKKKGAPVEWRALEPVISQTGSSGMTVNAPHPHVALLFLDYLQSKEGQILVTQGDLSSPRSDIGGEEKKFKRTYLDSMYPLEDYEKKYNEWEDLMRRLFIRKK